MTSVKATHENQLVSSEPNFP